MPTRCSRGGLTGLRLRRLISFLRRNGLSATAHTLERQTGVFFDAAHLRRLLLEDRCAAASSYALRFVTVGDCSPEAEALNVRILVLRVIADFAAGQAHAVDALFQRLYANLHFYKDSEAIGKLLLSMRSDRTKASILHRRLKPKAVDVIMDLVAKCPELQAKARLPRCTFDPAYIMSLRPPGGLWQYRSHHKNKIGRIPAHVLARSFLQKRPPHICQEEIAKPGVRIEGGRLYQKEKKRGSSPPTDDMGPSSAVLLLHLRRLDRFLKRQGLHRAAHALERESLVHFDAAHLQKLVKEGRWSAAWRYLGRFSPLWEPEGEGTNQQYTALMHSLSEHSLLAFLACRGEEGGHAARTYFSCPSHVAYPSDEAFRAKFHHVIQRHELYRSMTSAQARESVDWDSIKLTTLDKIQELLRLRPDLESSLRMRSPQHIPTPSEIIPLGTHILQSIVSHDNFPYCACLRGPRRHRRKGTDRKPSRQVAHFLLQKRLSSGQGTDNSRDSGVSSNASSSSLALDMQTEQNAPEPIILGEHPMENLESAPQKQEVASLKRTPPGADTSGVSGMLGGDGRVRKEEVDSSKSKKCKMSAMSETDASFSCMSSGLRSHGREREQAGNVDSYSVVEVEQHYE
ncbi:hypothetical protein EJB05_54180 [Eragrostis curvula]|uniref:LisH domain-containing protein n=1 Tax=Eragrostis curvula TaxID=38414 RepID=A0A5J9SN17_9POAL|nr:hypothetical protein EJB05_54180 [Eragrostis curvula]